jgi:hypothetical protein
MAMKRSFYTIDGVIVGEQTSAGRINYATDALGSVTGTLVGSQLVNTYTYKPYGALLATTGSGAAPEPQWLGTLGAMPTGRADADVSLGSSCYSTSRLVSQARAAMTTVGDAGPGNLLAAGPFRAPGRSPQVSLGGRSAASEEGPSPMRPIRRASRTTGTPPKKHRIGHTTRWALSLRYAACPSKTRI